MTDAPPIMRRKIGRYVVETCALPDGTVLLRTPEIYPLNARDWREPYPDMKTALADFAARTAIPKINRTRLAQLRRHGFAGDVCGKEMITRLDPWTGATTLSEYELVEETAGA
ncbi:hypothetical protein [Acetobacter estunensis]|uniref:hypothetical protein n=1 Tax=Acetobacter estunensis TaxID=104097 RepID=UPI001C2CDB74|nr:hypothetical protein [Acetobacter estunensis]MBV1838510.1 hypothetical protein [Acetobacter estunensis]